LENNDLFTSRDKYGDIFPVVWSDVLLRLLFRFFRCKYWWFALSSLSSLRSI